MRRPPEVRRGSVVPKIPETRIDRLLESCQVIISKHGTKTCVVTIILPSGFEMTDSAACVDPADYSEEIGARLAMARLKDRLWELEGYAAHFETTST